MLWLVLVCLLDRWGGPIKEARGAEPFFESGLEAALVSACIQEGITVGQMLLAEGDRNK